MRYKDERFEVWLCQNHLGKWFVFTQDHLYGEAWLEKRDDVEEQTFDTVDEAMPLFLEATSMAQEMMSALAVDLAQEPMEIPA